MKERIVTVTEACKKMGVKPIVLHLLAWTHVRPETDPGTELWLSIHEYYRNGTIAPFMFTYLRYLTTGPN